MNPVESARKYIPNSVKTSYYQLIHTAYDRRLLPSTRDYRRFLVLASGRTGSTLLIRTLGQHPQVVAYGELFRKLDTFPEHYQQFARAEPLYRADPARFLEDRVFRRYPAHVAAVGFKIFYEHAPQHLDWGKAVWAALHSQPDLHIIHLRRLNRLRAFLSLKRAARTHEWIHYSDASARDQPIHLDHTETAAWFEMMHAREENYGRLLCRYRCLDLTYEELTERMDDTMRRLQEFLGLRYRPLTPRTRKRPRRPLSAEIANYHELKALFQGTPWTEYFNE